MEHLLVYFGSPSPARDHHCNILLKLFLDQDENDRAVQLIQVMNQLSIGFVTEYAYALMPVFLELCHKQDEKGILNCLNLFYWELNEFEKKHGTASESPLKFHLDPLDDEFNTHIVELLSAAKKVNYLPLFKDCIQALFQARGSYQEDIYSEVAKIGTVEGVEAWAASLLVEETLITPKKANPLFPNREPLPYIHARIHGLV